MNLAMIYKAQLDACKKALSEAHVIIEKQKSELEAAQRVIVKVYEILPYITDSDAKESLIKWLAVYGGGE